VMRIEGGRIIPDSFLTDKPSTQSFFHHAHP